MTPDAACKPTTSCCPQVPVTGQSRKMKSASLADSGAGALEPSLADTERSAHGPSMSISFVQYFLTADPLYKERAGQMRVLPSHFSFCFTMKTYLTHIFVRQPRPGIETQKGSMPDLAPSFIGLTHFLKLLPVYTFPFHQRSSVELGSREVNSLPWRR